MNIKIMKFVVAAMALLSGLQSAHGMSVAALVAGKIVGATGLTVLTDKAIKTVGNKIYKFLNEEKSKTEFNEKLAEVNKNTDLSTENREFETRNIRKNQKRKLKREKSAFFTKYFGIHRTEDGGRLETLANVAKAATLRGGLDPRLMWFGLVSPESLAAVMLTREIYSLAGFCAGNDESPLNLLNLFTTNPLDAEKPGAKPKVLLTVIHLPVFLPLLFACKKIGIFKKFTNGLPKKISDKLRKTVALVIPGKKEHFTKVN